MKLYELTEQYNRLLELAEETDAAAFQDALEHLTDSINEKAENIAHVLQQMKSDINTLKDEEKRLKERRMTLERKQEHLRWYLQQELESADIKQVKSARFTISLRNSAPKVQIIDDDLIPRDYKVMNFSIDKKTLKEALQNGLEINGASLVQERSLNIR